MCGIAGVVDWTGRLTDEQAILSAMTATKRCRGPDDSGLWSSRHAALGHRRLAVIDIEGGAQPMIASKTCMAPGEGFQDQEPPPVVLVYSGEVYNFGQLRTELRAYGHSFRTRSDTEVVLRSYLEWGSGCVTRFNGMFAFAIWDAGSEALLLARDRLGIKPLYYQLHPSGLVFGSEPKALLASGVAKAEVNADGLRDLFGLWPFKPPGSAIYRGMRELLPGHILRVRREGVRLERYWRLEIRPHTDDLDTTAATVRDLLDEAVAGQLAADVPLCALLSGGLDSSAVTALAVRRMGHPQGKLTTFAVDLDGSGTSFQPTVDQPSRDAPFARLMAGHVGTMHTEIAVDTPDLLTAEVTAVRARDLPTMGDLDSSLHLLFAALREHTTVALSGESADEIFGGYPWFALEAHRPSDTFPWLRAGRSVGPFLAPDLRERLRLQDYVRDRYADAVHEIPVLAGEDPVDRRVRQVCHLHLTHFLGALLDRKDRMSMAVGLEVRVPYCDHRLVQYVWNVPWRIKRAGGMEKGLLRCAVADLLPGEIRTRTKSRFPSVHDPAYAGAIRRRLRESLADPTSPLAPLLHTANVRCLTEQEFPAPMRPMANTAIAFLLSVGTWLREYKITIDDRQ